MTRTSRSTRIRNLLPALVALTLALGMAGGCSADEKVAKTEPAEKAASSLAYPVTITDDASRTVVVDAEPQRIVSLAPANTEILFELGLGERVVGVTSFDDYPAAVADIAKVGDFAGPNLEAIAAADPDLILATTGVQADIIAKLEELGATVVAVDPQTLTGLYEDINEIAAVTNRVDEGNELVADMRAKVVAIRQEVANEEPVTAFIEIGQSPLFTVGQGTLLAELVELGGGKNIVAESGYVPYSVEQVIKADPQVYLATLGTMSDPKDLQKRPGYKGLSAVKSNRIVIMDDNLVTRPGPRIVEGLEQIARGLHPDAFAEK